MLAIPTLIREWGKATAKCTVKQPCVRIYTRIILFKNCILKQIHENWQLRGRKGPERGDKFLGVTETGGNRRRLGEEKGEGLDPLLCTFPVLWLIDWALLKWWECTANIIFFIIYLYALFFTSSSLKVRVKHCEQGVRQHLQWKNCCAWVWGVFWFAFFFFIWTN